MIGNSSIINPFEDRKVISPVREKISEENGKERKTRPSFENLDRLSSYLTQARRRRPVKISGQLIKISRRMKLLPEQS